VFPRLPKSVQYRAVLVDSGRLQEYSAPDVEYRSHPSVILPTRAAA
jgi:hypothetical protein